MIDIKFVKTENRVVAYDDEIEIGECKFEEVEETWNIVHTGVDGKYQGQGIAKRLVKCVIENSEKLGKNLIAECSYAKKLLETLHIKGNMNQDIMASNCLNMQYTLLKGMFFDNKKNTDNYILCTSKVMDDYFWNIAYLKDKINKEILNNLENEFKSMNRKSSIYLGKNDISYNENKKILLTNGYTLNNTDVYMTLEKATEININTRIKIIENEKEYNDFMNVLSSAYNDVIENAEENVYADAVTECYYDAIKNTMNSKEHIHIIVYDNDIPVSVATLNYVNGMGGINNVGTAQGHWNKGYGKQLITYVINKFENLGGGILTLSTEYHSKNQQFYEKLGFKPKYVMEQYMK